MKRPGHRDHQPGEPPPVPDNHHPGRQVRGRLPRAEGSQARHELIWITAPVGMVRPDELPTAPLGFTHPALTGLTVATCIVSQRRLSPGSPIPAYRHSTHDSKEYRGCT